MPDAQSPLTPAMFNVMLALADGDKHGYAVLKEVAEQTAGEVQLSTGTLYGIIKRLLAEGLIVEVRRHPAIENDDQRRRYYHLTDSGRAVALAEAERLERQVERARSKQLIRALKPV
ncbi:MAG TPA: PadR family transcriptional regulator [Bryobacteraceae bacterium]|nr:PadR family transcriptional regulator [Bryobacteraceae bacterium]